MLKEQEQKQEQDLAGPCSLCCPGTQSSTRGLLGPRRGGPGAYGSQPPKGGSAGGAGDCCQPELFAPHRLPGAQGPFLGDILDGRAKPNSLSPPRGTDVQSQQHAGGDRPLRPKRVRELEGPSLLL